MAHEVNVRKVGSDEPNINKLFLVTVETEYEVHGEDVVSNKEDLSKRKIVQVEERSVTNEELEALGTECKQFNQRQEFYINDDRKNGRELNPLINFQYISSVDPRAEKTTEENI